MIIAVTILSVLLFITLLISLSCAIHIFKLNKERDLISEEQSRQNEDIRNIMVSHMTLVQALKEAAETEQKISGFYNYSKIKGEA
jgi:hypothetical protein